MLKTEIKFISLVLICMISLSCNDNDKLDLVKIEIDKYVADNKLKTKE